METGPEILERIISLERKVFADEIGKKVRNYGRDKAHLCIYDIAESVRQMVEYRLHREGWQRVEH
jgi:hypothetical protein